MARLGTAFNSVVAGLPPNATETVIATVGPISPTVDGGLILIMWSIIIQMGSTGTSFVHKLRQGVTITGPLLWNPGQGIAVTPPNNMLFSGFAFDVNGGADQMYCLTSVSIGATAGSTVSNVSILAISL